VAGERGVANGGTDEEYPLEKTRRRVFGLASHMSSIQDRLLKRAWVRYALAVVTIGAAFLFRLLLTRHVGPDLPTYITFFPAVMVVALLGGLGPGLLATATTAVAVDYWIVSPGGLFWHADPAGAVGLVLFGFMGVFMSFVAELYRRSRRQAAAYEKELALRKSQEELRESEHRLNRTEVLAQQRAVELNAVFEAITDALFVYDTKGRPLRANAVATALVGVGREGVVDEAAMQALLKARQPRHLDGRLMSLDELPFRRALAGETVRGQAYSLTTAEGRDVTVESTAAIMQSPGGPAGVVVLVRDITERKRAERLREQHQARLRTLIEVSQEILGEANVPALLQKVVDAARGLTGGRLAVCGHGFADGKFRVGAASCSEGVPACPPGETFQEAFQVQRGGVYGELLEGRNTIRYSAKELSEHPRWWGLPDGHPPLNGLVGARVMSADGTPSGVILVSDKLEGEFSEEDEAVLGQLAALASLALQNLEAREKAEERANKLTTVFDSMADAVIIHDASGAPAQVNLTAAETYGISPEPTDIGGERHAHRLRYLDGRPVPSDEAPCQRALAGEVIRGQRYLFTDAQGSTRTVQISSAPFRVGDRITGTVAVWHDVTEREFLVQQLAQAHDELELRVQERTADLREAVDRLRTEIAVREKAEHHLEGVRRMLELFATHASRNEYVRAVVRLLRTWSGCRGVGIRLVTEEGLLPYAACVGFGWEFLREEKRLCLRPDGCGCMRALLGGAEPGRRPDGNPCGSFFCNNADEYAAVLQAPAQPSQPVACQNAGYESVAQVAIRQGALLLGTIHFADPRPSRFPPETTNFIESVAPLLGEALNRFNIEESLKESEGRFRTMFEKHDAAMLLVEPESGRIVDANEAAATFFGYARDRFPALHTADLDMRIPASPSASRREPGSGTRRLFETSARLSSGDRRTLEVHVSPISVQRRPLLFAIIHDVTERKMLEKRILEVSDAERRSIGQDLHDSLGGHLTGIALLGKALAQSLAQQAHPESPIAAEVVHGLNEAISQTRAISHGLCPVEEGELGLLSSLHEYAADVLRRTQTDCQFRASPGIAVRDPLVADHLFRIVQEAVTNALRHGEPRRIEIRLELVKDRPALTVWNDGKPLPPDTGRGRGLGLRTMQFRANAIGADFEVRRAAAGGTVVSCLLPPQKEGYKQTEAATDLT